MYIYIYIEGTEGDGGGILTLDAKEPRVGLHRTLCGVQNFLAMHRERTVERAKKRDREIERERETEGENGEERRTGREGRQRGGNREGEKEKR